MKKNIYLLLTLCASYMCATSVSVSNDGPNAVEVYSKRDFANREVLDVVDAGSRIWIVNDVDKLDSLAFKSKTLLSIKHIVDVSKKLKGKTAKHLEVVLSRPKKLTGWEYSVEALSAAPKEGYE